MWRLAWAAAPVLCRWAQDPGTTAPLHHCRRGASPAQPRSTASTLCTSAAPRGREHPAGHLPQGGGSSERHMGPDCPLGPSLTWGVALFHAKSRFPRCRAASLPGTKSCILSKLVSLATHHGLFLTCSVFLCIAPHFLTIYLSADFSFLLAWKFQ